MSKTLVNHNEYFVESKKALQVAREREIEERSKLKTEELLELAKKHKEKAKTPEEYEELGKLEKDLSMKIKFNQYYIPAVPPEHTEKLKKNAEVEHQAASKKLSELKSQLKSKIDYLENEVAPLVDGIKKLEQMMSIPEQINIILDTDIGEKAPLTMEGRLRYYYSKYDNSQTGRAVAELDKLIHRLRVIQGNEEVENTTKAKRKGDK